MTEIEVEFRREELAGMGPQELLAEAEAGGLKVFADGDRLVVRGPKTAEMDLVNAVLSRKPALMRLLTLAADEREYFEERAAIAEHDGGLSRAEAERLAWEEVRANRRAKNHLA